MWFWYFYGSLFLLGVLGTIILAYVVGLPEN